MTRDELLVLNVMSFLAEKYVEQGMEPAAFAAASIEEEGELLKDFTQKMVAMSERGERYVEHIFTEEGIESSKIYKTDGSKN